MKNRSLLRAAVASTILIGFSVAAHAQSEPQKKNATASQSQKTAPKPHKVWTEDNIAIVRTPADAIIDAQDRQTVNNAAAVQETSQKQPVAVSSKPPAKKAPLAQAKSAEDADFKIEWEKKDIQGQEETISALQERLDSATPEEREHLQQLIEQHKQYLADTRKEMQGLQEQKKDFQKNPAAQTAPAGSQPPSQ